MKKLSNRVELYIDLGKGTEERTLRAFRALEDQKAAIEAAFGEDLIWQDLPESRGCRISFEQEGGWSAPEGLWPEVQDRMIDAMVRLEAAIKSRVMALAIE
jgi:hypothetical protein